MDTTQELYTPEGETPSSYSLAQSPGLSASGLAVIVVASILGAAVLGLVLTVLITVYVAKKRAGSLTTPPYGNPTSSQYYVGLSSRGSSSSSVPTAPQNYFIFYVSSTDGQFGSAFATLPSTPGVQSAFETKPGLYMIKTRNYIEDTSKDAKQIDIETYFVPNDAFLAPLQVTTFLDDVIASKPPFAGLSVWGDATKILTNKDVIQKIAKLGGKQLTSQTSYVAGSPYIFYYANAGNSVEEYAGGAGTYIYNTGYNSSINGGVDSSSIPIANPSSS